MYGRHISSCQLVRIHCWRQASPWTCQLCHTCSACINHCRPLFCPTAGQIYPHHFQRGLRRSFWNLTLKKFTFKLRWTAAVPKLCYHQFNKISTLFTRNIELNLWGRIKLYYQSLTSMFCSTTKCIRCTFVEKGVTIWENTRSIYR